MRGVRSPIIHLCNRHHILRNSSNMNSEQVFRFHKWEINKSQIFFNSTHCYGLINLKPIVPGHVLVISKRVVPRLADLTSEEVADLFDSVHKIGPLIEKQYSASALNIAIQDGISAGQSVPHVHVHLLPRKPNDFARSDDVYEELERHRAQEAVLLGGATATATATVTSRAVDSSGSGSGSSVELASVSTNVVPAVRNTASSESSSEDSGGLHSSQENAKVDFKRERQPRTETDMAEESSVLRALLAQHGVLGVHSW